MRLLLLPALLLTLAACSPTTISSSPTVPAPLPPPIDVQCPAALEAVLSDEPLPPEGISLSRLSQVLVATFGEEKGLALFEWALIRLPQWGRQAAAQADAGRVFCSALDEPR